MSTGTADVRDIVDHDLPWLVGLARARRERLVRHAPRFWRPAADADERHRAFLAGLVADPAVAAVRTEHGFAIATDKGTRWLVDDMVVEPARHWLDEGFLMLLHLRAQAPGLRLVAPAFERERTSAARAAGLEPAEEWWLRDLAGPAGGSTPGAAPEVTVPGAEGRLVPAPPVYDPGGPVLLVTRVDSAAALRAVGVAAVRRGARVVVVSVAPGDRATGAVVREAGLVLTTVFHESPPS